jgi:DNA-binding transcriptional LysR family regulator
MELRVLSYFLAIAREENITRAAQNLHVTQPTLSRQIAQLEDELGVKLFVRSNHNIILTEDGMILKRRAQEIISLAEKTRMDLTHNEHMLTGEIAIGSGEFQATAFLSELINAFHKKHPLVKYSIYSGNASNIHDYIERGLLDIALVSEPIDIGKYDFISVNQKETWGALVRSDSDLAAKEYLTPEDLKDYPIIISSREPVKEMYGKWLGTNADDLNIASGGTLLYNMAGLVSAGMGAAICIKLNCTYDNCKFIPLSPKIESGSFLVRKKDQVFSRATSEFIEFSKLYSKGISGNNL